MMIFARPTFAFFAILALLVLSFGTVFAQTASAQETDSETPTNAPEPAIAVPEEAPEDETPEWPYRFLVPATLVLGTVAVVGSIIMYFVRVTKNRYRVVE